MLSKVRVAVIREEGSNGDREMAAAVYAAGLEPWDITMSDLLQVGGVGHVRECVCVCVHAWHGQCGHAAGAFKCGVGPHARGAAPHCHHTRNHHSPTAPRQ
jgi:hypothetical protein